MNPRAAAIGIALLFGATAGAAEKGGSAYTVVKDAHGTIVAKATFVETPEGVQVRVKASGLPPGKHGIHLHDKGACDPPAFSTAGGHFNPLGRHHGAQNPEGRHAGDLPNLEVKPDGTAEMTATAFGATLGKAGTSLLKKGGTSLVIHEAADDEKTDPSGQSGARIACGVVTR